MLKLVELILLVPTTNAVSKRSHSVNVKIYLLSSMTQEPVSSCLIVTTYKKQVDKLKLVKAASLSWFKNEHHFSIKEWIFPRRFTESATKGTQTLNQKCSSAET